jgi:hypothetical protein
MRIQIMLRPDIEAELTAQACRMGVPIDRYVEHILEQYVPVHPVETKMSPEQRTKAFDDWLQNFPNHRAQPLPEEAIRREDLNRRDGE